MNIFAFSVASAALDVVFNKIGIFEYITWNPFYRFIGSLLWFYGLKVHSKVLAPKATQDTKKREAF